MNMTNHNINICASARIDEANPARYPAGKKRRSIVNRRRAWQARCKWHPALW